MTFISFHWSERGPTQFIRPPPSLCYLWQNEIILRDKKRTALFQTHNWKKSNVLYFHIYTQIRDSPPPRPPLPGVNRVKWSFLSNLLLVKLCIRNCLNKKRRQVAVFFRYNKRCIARPPKSGVDSKPVVT